LDKESASVLDSILRTLGAVPKPLHRCRYG
jgi:hypothetical protein